MVLLELTAITAYFLGLKRTYRIALRLQRRLIGPNHPRIRQFVYRRTRDVFDVAVKVHKNIQQRDIDLGRNLGNWILRWLHRMKPSAEIRPPASDVSTNNKNFPKSVARSSQSHVAEDKLKSTKESNDRVQFTSLTPMSKNFPTMPMNMMIQPRSFPNRKSQHRQISNSVPYSLLFQRRGFAGVVRDDIAHWLRR